jgi:hypothetical protein
MPRPREGTPPARTCLPYRCSGGILASRFSMAPHSQGRTTDRLVEQPLALDDVVAGMGRSRECEPVFRSAPVSA